MPPGSGGAPRGLRHPYLSPGIQGGGRTREEPAERASGWAGRMGLEAALELECAALGALLREPQEAERTLLLDCRPFLAFCRRRVRSARPVPWNALLRRRARGPPAAALACLLPDRALRARLARGELARVVVLDEDSASLAALPPDGPARVLLAALAHETRPGRTAVCLLRGERTHPGTPGPSRPDPPGLPRSSRALLARPTQTLLLSRPPRSTWTLLAPPPRPSQILPDPSGQNHPGLP